MTEKTIVKKIVNEVKRRGGKVIKTHGSRYMPAGTPDLIGVLGGVSFAVEVKRQGVRPTPVQAAELKEWQAQGWAAGVATSVEEFLAIVAPAHGARRARMFTCEECGKLGTAKQRNRRFCSERCKKRAQRRRDLEEGERST